MAHLRRSDQETAQRHTDREALARRVAAAHSHDPFSARILVPRPVRKAQSEQPFSSTDPAPGGPTGHARRDTKEDMLNAGYMPAGQSGAAASNWISPTTGEVLSFEQAREEFLAGDLSPDEQNDRLEQLDAGYGRQARAKRTAAGDEAKAAADAAADAVAEAGTMPVSPARGKVIWNRFTPEGNCTTCKASKEACTCDPTGHPVGHPNFNPKWKPMDEVREAMTPQAEQLQRQALHFATKTLRDAGLQGIRLLPGSLQISQRVAGGRLDLIKAASFRLRASVPTVVNRRVASKAFHVNCSFADGHFSVDSLEHNRQVFAVQRGSLNRILASADEVKKPRKAQAAYRIVPTARTDRDEYEIVDANDKKVAGPFPTESKAREWIHENVARKAKADLVDDPAEKDHTNMARSDDADESKRVSGLKKK